MFSFAFRQDCATSTLDSFIQTLTHVLPKDAVVVASIDFSHYQTGPVADFHDAYSIGVIKQFDYSRLQQLEIDSAQSLYVLMKSMEARGAERVAYDLHTNGARLAHNQIEENITSYYTPFFVDGPKANVGVVSLLSFGDVMLDRGVEEHIQKKGVDSILGQLAGDENRFFQGMDVISVNLEGTFARVRTPTSKSIAFRFDPAYIPFLTVRNISLVSLANNHGHDMGAGGVEETHILLRDAGIDAVGDQYTVSSSSLIMKTIGDRKMAWIAVNDVEVTLNVTSTLALIAQAKQNGATVIINVHWGTEYMLVSNTRQRLLAHQFIDAGADVIIGHHPHVVEEIEVYKGRAIFYSLGNFVFDQYFSKETQQGLGVGMVFGSTSTLFYLFPVQSIASEARQMRGWELNKFATGLIDRSRLGSYTIDKSTLSFSLPYGK
jgi:poly-gamma-glutamate synthesis protein (capsule biosynthesis protein)